MFQAVPKMKETYSSEHSLTILITSKSRRGDASIFSALWIHNESMSHNGNKTANATGFTLLYILTEYETATLGNFLYFPDLPALLVDCTAYLRELAVDEPELDEIWAENCDGGDRPFVHLVDVHQMQRLEPVPDHLQSVAKNAKFQTQKDRCIIGCALLFFICFRNSSRS